MQDVNGTRAHLVMARGDWTRCEGVSLQEAPAAEQTPAVWDDERYGVRLRAYAFLFKAAASDAPPSLEGRRGAARDRNGNWYVIDASSRRVMVSSSGDASTSLFWPLPEAPCASRSSGAFAPREAAPARAAVTLAALAVTHDHRLVVGALEDGSARAWILVFDLLEGGPPLWLLWPRGSAAAGEYPVVPFDMAALPGGGVWILDRVHRRLWRLNRYFRIEVVRPDPLAPTPDTADHGGFHRADGRAPDPETVTSPALRGDEALALTELGVLDDPITVEAVEDDLVLVVARTGRVGAGDPFTGSRVVGYHRDGHVWSGPHAIELSAVLASLPEEQRRLLVHDAAFSPEPEGGRAGYWGVLLAASHEGNQVFAFDLKRTAAPSDPTLAEHLRREGFELVARTDYYPMRSFSAEGVVHAGGETWYPSRGRWVPLQAQRRPVFEERAVIIAPGKDSSFDGAEPDCAWHRIMLDVRLPPGTRVTVQSRAARTIGEMLQQPWRDEPAPRRRDGSELPWVTEPDDHCEGTSELLVQNARGRFLQLRVTLEGDRTRTPTVRALRVWYPRYSYLARYLPAVYREDRESASFVERFLAIPEAGFTALEGRIAAVQALFGARSVPSEFAPWLLGWIGAEGEVLPDDARRRLFLAHAMLLYRARGTLPGLRMALRLALDECVDERIFTEAFDDDADGARVVERFRARGISAVRLGDPTRTGFDALPVDTATAIARAGAITEAYVTALAAEHLVDDSGAFPFAVPEDDDRRAIWERVAWRELGIVPSITAADAGRWRAFLRRRHRTPAALRTAHGVTAATPASFDEVQVPTELPSAPGALRDWYDFERVVMSRVPLAHRFTVLLPMPAGAVAGSEDARARQAVAAKVISLQKPAHTVFELRFFWSMFRVGEARLGRDTRLEGDPRARLLPAAVAGVSYAGESAVSAGDTTLTRKRVGEAAVGLGCD